MSRRWTIALDLRWSALICLCCAATCIADSKASPISASSFALKYEGYNEAARELQDIFANEHVQQLLRDQLVIEELPVLKLVVIGDQSAGKSTLIQRITRVPMYRGTGTKTRCPLEVRMLSGDKSKGRTYSIKTKAHDGSSEERVLKVFTNVEDAGRHVQEAQDHVLGGKDFSKTPIIIEVHNAGFSLTLVDLPGFIVQDTNNVISNMASDYMLQPGTLILAVVQAINENELIHSLNLIRKTKGTCSNCMAVLTKLRSGQELQIDSWADAFSGKGPWKDVIAKDSWFAMEIRQNDTLSNYDDTDAWERQFFHGHHITTLSSRNSTGLGALHAEVDRRLAQLTASVLQQSYKTATHLLRLIKAAQNPEGNQEPTDDAQKHINKLLSTTAEAVRWTVARASAHDDPCPSLTRPLTVTNWKVHENKIYARFLAEVQKYSPGNSFLTEETGAAEPAELTFELIARKPTKKALKVGLGMMIEDPPVDGGEMRSLWLRLASMWVDKLWPVHVRKCLEDMTEHLKAVLHDKWQHKVCGRYPILERKISAYLDDFITDLYTGTEKALALLNARETFTVTGPIAETYTLFKDEFRNTRGNILRAANKTDPNVDPRVMEEFVDLQTWYEVLHRRYADAVVLTIRYDLVRKSLDFADYCMDRLKTEARQEYKTAINPVHELPEQTDDARLHDLTKLIRTIAGRLTEQGAQALPHYAPALLDAAESTDAERRSSLLKAQQQLEITVEKLATLVK